MDFYISVRQRVSSTEFVLSEKNLTKITSEVILVEP